MLSLDPFNHESIIESIGSQLNDNTTSRTSPKRQRLPSSLCLPDRLPNSSFIQREAEMAAPRAILRQLRRSPSPPSEADDLDSEDGRHTRNPSSASTESTSPSASPSRSSLETQRINSAWKEPQPFEVLRAVERKDLIYLMEIRDRAFHLLLRKWGDVTPLLHAMRIGKSHRDVAIILLGSFSRYINHLDDSELQKPRTKTILKALRANLKLAIDVGLAKSQSDLTASFMQTLIMSEGDKWIHAQTSNVVIALRAGTAGEPVKTADAAVRKFATKELGKAELIASLEDYIANAVIDLLLLAAWTLALETINGDPIPISYFARDDRMYKALVERLEKNEKVIRQSLSRRLKWQLRVMKTALEGRTTTYRRKVEVLAEELDQGDGV
ncbi:hypothetical protein F5879DRAFT_930467 [Lentinula edodes]|uniref:uncharacterized protein n=1 Tax=Lentinula edodes TaxID=5353 RepID=UPI001BFB16BC|nr:uncharacterized protein C8R40DRAFT_1140351 [Lentinula edodes]KAF8826660.1 hypothetical protein HHX47_DHR5000135 [Lentinula edodes]KAH7879707.1 hypothetical protein C8R40DRAFT_1140351 [Lentinula edodes]KAJ3910190.1 hypothetical protein F5879DRAFT_930467 [Lentinula edodes]